MHVWRGTLDRRASGSALRLGGRALPLAPVTVTALDAGPGFAAALAVGGWEMPPLKLFPLDVERRRSDLRHLLVAPR